MDIIIRLSPYISPTCVKWITDKDELIDKCFRSLFNLVTDQHLYFLVDQMDGSKFSQYGRVYQIDKGNKRETIDAMFDLATNLSDDLILFLEDDYLWRPDAELKRLEDAIWHFGTATPYDHPDHYRHPVRKFHHLEQFQNNLFRNCVTTTHTFGVQRELFTKYRPHFNYGEHDWQMWTKLDTEGVTIWSPLPSYATHLADQHTALGYNWKGYYATL